MFIENLFTLNSHRLVLKIVSHMEQWNVLARTSVPDIVKIPRYASAKFLGLFLRTHQANYPNRENAEMKLQLFFQSPENPNPLRAHFFR